MTFPHSLRKGVVSSLLFVWAFTWGVYLLESFRLIGDNMPEQVDQTIEDPLSAPIEKPPDLSIELRPVSPYGPLNGFVSAVLPAATFHVASEGLNYQILARSLPERPPLSSAVELFKLYSIYRI